MNSVTDAVTLVAVVVQILIFSYTLLRGNRLKTGRIWLPVTAFMLIMTTIAYALIPLEFSVGWIGSPQLLSILWMITLIIATGLISRDLAEKQWRIFFMIGGIWLLVVLVLLLTTNNNYLGEPAWIVQAITQISAPEIATIGGFIILSFSLFILAFYTFYITPLPEVSNRALFWVFNIAITLTGFTLAISGTPTLVLLGMVIFTVSLIATTYSQLSYRVFDIRNVLGMIVRVILLITLTSVAIFSALNLIDQLNLTDRAEKTILAGTLATLIAAIYTPVRELANFAITRFLVGKNADAVEATKRYSHEVSQAMEIDELIDISSRTLNEVLNVKRSGMLLVSDTSESYIELQVMRGGGFKNLSQQLRGQIVSASPIYTRIAKEQQPLSQFDIEFNPDYQTCSESEKHFFRDLEMSAYAPIIMNNTLIGLLACGAKNNDAPFYTRDLELLVALANQTGVALRNTRLVADLRHLNNTMQALNRSLGDANDQMNKLDSVKTDFVTVASHELRTPLAQVRGYTDIIDALNDQGMLDQDQTRGLVNNLRKATERMEELIAAMLDVSQLDVNAMDLRFAQTSLESVLRMAIEPLTDPIKQRKLTLSARGLRGLPPIEADMQRLVQAFRNIITNAIKFTPDGGSINITASYHPSETATGRDYILIAIADTGIGIGKEHVELIFNKFYRAADPGLHSTGTYKFMGAGPGLGLTIAKGVIDGHGGRIWAESPGYNVDNPPGSVFYTQLPLTPPENARRVLPFEGDNENARTTNEMKVVKQ